MIKSSLLQYVARLGYIVNVYQISFKVICTVSISITVICKRIFHKFFALIEEAVTFFIQGKNDRLAGAILQIEPKP
jgi:hypothetical protein